MSKQTSFQDVLDVMTSYSKLYAEIFHRLLMLMVAKPNFGFLAKILCTFFPIKRYIDLG